MALLRNTPHAEAQHTLKGPSTFCVWPERSWAKEGGCLPHPAVPPNPQLLTSWAHLGTLELQAWKQQSVQLGPRGDRFPNLNGFPS